MIKILPFLFGSLILFSAPAQADTSAVSLDTLTVIGVGDIMMGTDYPSAMYLPPGNDCRPLLQDVSEILQEADITFGNMEGTFAGNTEYPRSAKTRPGALYSGCPITM